MVKKKSQTKAEETTVEKDGTEEYAEKLNIEVGEENPTENEAEKLRQELGELKESHIRLMAEFDNFRKRTQREKADLIQYGGADLMKSMLPILDNFARSLEAFEKTANIESLKEGIMLVNKNMWENLNKKGLELIEAKGYDFNSALHEAITTLPVADESQKGRVIEEIEKGYKLHDRVIRYAKVVVGE